MPPSPASPLDTVLSEFWQLVTVNTTFLQHQLLRSATLQWNGRTIRGRQRIVRYLRQKQRVGAFRGIAFEHPTACAPFDQQEPTNQPDGNDAKPNSQEAIVELQAALAAGGRRAARGKKRASAMTAASDDDNEGQAHSEPEKDGHDLFSNAPALTPDPTELFDDGFQTPPRASDVTVPLVPASYQALHIAAKEGKSASSSDSSRSNSEDDDEFTNQQVPEDSIEKLRPIDETSPGLGTVYTVTAAEAETSVSFEELQYLRATSSTDLSPAGASSPTHGYLYRNTLVVDSTSPNPPTLGLSYRIHCASRRPHFDRIVFRWPTPYAGQSAVRRKLFETEPKNDQDGAAVELETPTMLVSGRPATPQHANVSVEQLPRSPPPSQRPIRYPNPPGTPVKRRRNIAMRQRTPSAVAGSITSPTSSSSSSSSNSSSNAYGRFGRKQLRSATPPSVSPTRAAATNTNVSTASPHIPFLFGHTGASESGAMLIRLGNTPLATFVREGTRDPPAGAATTTPSAPVRKPLRF